MASHFDIQSHLGTGECLTETTSNADWNKVSEEGEGPIYLSGCSPGHSIIPECEVFLEGEGEPKIKSKLCKKNPGHFNFIPVDQFTADHLPKHLRTEHILCAIRERIERTVLLRVGCISNNRPDTFQDSKARYPYSVYKGAKTISTTGTGTIVSDPCRGHVVDNCPCPNCEECGNPRSEYWKYHITTATHVVFDHVEAKKTVARCFFDSDGESEEAVTLYGVDIESVQSQEDMLHSDMCDNLICVTHDKSLVDKIKKRIGRFFPYNKAMIYGAIVSHPHGCPKMVSVGNLLYRTIPIKPKYEIGRPEKFPGRLPIMCHFPLNCDKTDDGDSNSSSSKPCCTNIKLPSGTTFTLPVGALYSMRYHFDSKLISFPPGTKFYSEDGAAIPIPDNSLFENKDLKRSSSTQHHSVSYDIPTCPGSSGALIPRDVDENSLYNLYCPISHFGCSGNVDKRNCSSVTDIASRIRYVKKFIKDSNTS